MSSLRTLATPAANLLYEQINEAHTPDQLDDLVRRTYRGNGEGSISDDDAAFLHHCVNNRRPLGRNTAPGFAKPIGPLAERVLQRFHPRRYQRSPDQEASRARRRL